MKKKLSFGLVGAFFALLIAVTPIFAHVVVRPAEVGVGKFQTFTVGVPVEKDVATTNVRLVIPGGLNHVTPNVKPGWTITTIDGPVASGSAMNHGDGDEPEAPIAEIIWSGGTIPVGQRDEFLFSAKVPSTPTTLPWKAYQTYADGSVVAWDMDPKAPVASGLSSTPYSVTQVVDDLAGDTTTNEVDTTVVASTSADYSMWVAALSLLVSIIALALVVMNKKKDQPAQTPTK